MMSFASGVASLLMKLGSMVRSSSPFRSGRFVRYEVGAVGWKQGRGIVKLWGEVIKERKGLCDRVFHRGAGQRAAWLHV